jgi:tRNA(Ile)-lysidine synthase
MVSRAVSRAARALDLAGRRVVVAISGGVDSTVLLHVMTREAGRLGIGVVAGHVNHGLRGAESDADEAAVRGLAEALEVPIRVAQVDPESHRVDRPSRERPTLQEAARRARYDALHKLASEAGAERIATAHTLDDQAETVLLRLLRGSGSDGLGGIPERSPDGRVVRPLLSVPREAIEHYARQERLSWREDPSNRHPRYARGRLRSGGLAELAAAVNPAWLRAVGDLAEVQRRDAEWLEQLVDDAWQRLFRESGDDLAIVRDGWGDLPEGLARRLMRRALREKGAGRDVTRAHLLRMLGFLRSARPGTRLELPGPLELHCGSEGFLLRRIGVRRHPEC